MHDLDHHAAVVFKNAVMSMNYFTSSKQLTKNKQRQVASSLIADISCPVFVICDADCCSRL